MKSIDLQFVKDTLLDLDPSLADSAPDRTYNTALVVLSALTCGPDITRLAAFTGLPEAFVAAIRDRMIRAELWTEISVSCDHWQVGAHNLDLAAFWADVLIAEGLVVQRWDEDKGEYCYCATEYAQDREQHSQAN
jgi:hypothetical protein